MAAKALNLYVEWSDKMLVIAPQMPHASFEISAATAYRITVRRRSRGWCQLELVAADAFSTSNGYTFCG